MWCARLRVRRECGRHSRIEDQPRDVLLGHAGQLVGEDVLEADEPHEDALVGLLVEGVADDVELNHAPALLQTGSFVARRVSRQQAGLSGSTGAQPRSSPFIVITPAGMSLGARPASNTQLFSFFFPKRRIK